MTKSEAIKKANEYYEKKRSEESLALNTREREVRERIPELDVLFVRRANLLLSYARAAIGNPGDAKEFALRMQNEGISINARVREVLKENGYPEDYLKIHYECPVCRDTGYVVDSMPAQMCKCFEKRIHEYMRESSLLNGNCFECFDERRIPNDEVAPGVTQRSLAVGAKKYCEAFCTRYPDVSPRNLILSGQAGLGKTFLLNSIADKMERLGHTCEVVSSFKLFETLRAKHFHEEDADSYYNDLISCPILLIDDLGCEPLLRNISEEYFCVLLNERMVPGKCTIIATNLTPPQIADRYGERVLSRLCDKSNWANIRLQGKDLRRI